MRINRLYNEDCMKTMSRMDDSFLDLTITSPPYDNMRAYAGNLVWYNVVWENIISELYRVTKHGGVVVWVVGDSTVNGSETGTSFQQALFFLKSGFKLNDTMIYSKASMPNCAKRYSQEFEFMFVFSKHTVKTFNPIQEKCVYAGVATSPSVRDMDGSLKRTKKRIIKDTKKLGNIWRFSAGANKSTLDTEAHSHPAIFPEELVKKHLLTWSNEHDIVYDPFAGSGTVPKMAMSHNRKYIGSEIVPEYFLIATKRIDKYKVE